METNIELTENCIYCDEEISVDEYYSDDREEGQCYMCGETM